MRIVLAACLLLGAACDFVPVPLPTAAATLHSVRLDLPRGSYCWSSGGKAVCADSAPADMLIDRGYLRPYRTAGGLDVAIAFQSKSQLRNFHVELVKSPTGNRSVKTTAARTFSLPEAPGVPAGIYVYMITSYWPQGDVSFFLPIELVPGLSGLSGDFARGRSPSSGLSGRGSVFRGLSFPRGDRTRRAPDA